MAQIVVDDWFLRPPRPGCSETAFQKLVTDLAEWTGWWWWHDNDPRWNDAGLPDLILVKPGHPLRLWELKTATGDVRPAQRALGALLARVPGIDYRVLRPADWPAIVRALTEED